MHQSVFFCAILILSLVGESLAMPRHSRTYQNNSIGRGDTATSSKLIEFGARLDSINEELRESASKRLKEKESEGIREYEEITANASPEEQLTLKESAINLYKNHPEAKAQLDEFFSSSDAVDSFDKADSKFSKYEEWNTYWNTWYKMYADYMQKYG